MNYTYQNTSKQRKYTTKYKNKKTTLNNRIFLPPDARNIYSFTQKLSLPQIIKAKSIRIPKPKRKKNKNIIGQIEQNKKYNKKSDFEIA